MRPEVLATVTHGVIRWSYHYCHALIDGPGVAGLRLQDITDFWHRRFLSQRVVWV